VSGDQGGYSHGPAAGTWSLKVVTMTHIHNEAVLAFLTAHKDHPNIRRFLDKERQAIEAMNKSLGTQYKDYLDYLEQNIGDDASWTMDELEALLRPRFEVRLSKKEKQDYERDCFDIGVDDLITPVYIKDEGDFFSIWEKDSRVDIPVRLLQRFIAFLKDNNVPYESEYDC
jgi:hypothetical protein